MGPPRHGLGPHPQLAHSCQAGEPLQKGFKGGESLLGCHQQELLHLARTGLQCLIGCHQTGVQKPGSQTPPRQEPPPGGRRKLFKMLSQAYQVLSNPIKRKNHDEQIAEVGCASIGEFFHRLCGDGAFENFIGQPASKTFTANSSTMLEKLQAIREARLVAVLKIMLQRYVDGDRNGFEVCLLDLDWVSRGHQRVGV